MVGAVGFCDIGFLFVSIGALFGSALKRVHIRLGS